jgi:hypothetical protein
MTNFQEFWKYIILAAENCVAIISAPRRNIMPISNRSRRFWIGFCLVVVVSAAGFGISNQFIPNWGSTQPELDMQLPGHDLFSSPVLKWKHAITIAAKPEQVWRWIIQMGDTHAGYYSYRFIEKAVTAAAGIDVSTYYNHTNRIVPEWQSPPIGQGMIMDVLVLREYQVNRYLVAGPKPELSEGGLLWTWAVSPTADGSTRLLVHMAIQIPGVEGNQAVTTALNLATFMMEKKMLDGIKLRAEGGVEPDWVEPLEAVLWFTTLVMGLVAARRFITRVEWKRPLAIGMTTILLLFVLVYIQPALWIRVLAVAGVIGALVWDSWLLRAKPVLQ